MEDTAPRPGENILIVEDQFIEANDLRSILEQAGHSVCGIARSVDQAITLIEERIPDIVLIDIFLKGDLTGIDLARTLTAKSIPFIYLSANSNPSTLEEAKMTEPYGFLVKPFREKDILIALEIATYRHRHTQEIVCRHGEWIGGSLSSIILKELEPEEKLLLLAKALQPYVHFDDLLIDTDLACPYLYSVIGVHRVNYEQYTPIDLSTEHGLIHIKDQNEIKQLLPQADRIIYRNAEVFLDSCHSNKISRRAHDLFQASAEMIVPIVTDGKINGYIALYSRQNDGFNSEQGRLLLSISNLLALVIDNIRGLRSNRTKKAAQTKTSAPVNNPPPGFMGIVGKSAKLLYALDQATMVAPFDTSVLILGETGSGKEGLVDVIHELSPRKGKPLIKINCAAIPEHLVESELFGHERGAFTGAAERRIGKFEQAKGGTIFLDEIGEIPLDVQSKLLRVIQEKEIERLGGRQTIQTDVRIIVATNRDLYKEVAKGNFRMDLFYRINIFPITLAPLRERTEDIALLADHFLQKFALQMGNTVKKLAPAALQTLLDYSWPGNIRELQHVIERAVIINTDQLIPSITLPEEIVSEKIVGGSRAAAGEKVVSGGGDSGSNGDRAGQSIEAVERAHIRTVLQRCGGKIAGKGGAAEVLQIPVTSLRNRMKRLGIRWQFIYET